MRSDCSNSQMVTEHVWLHYHNFEALTGTCPYSCMDALYPLPMFPSKNGGLAACSAEFVRYTSGSTQRCGIVNLLCVMHHNHRCVYFLSNKYSEAARDKQHLRELADHR